jgi:outer membrane receptor protein involved in Fe transport
MERFSKGTLWIVLMGLSVLLLMYVSADAGITGKISGRIIDEETGAELPGASIRIDGTTMGNMAGADGSYYILNITPGTYSVTASLIGYISVTAKDVKITSDLTTEQNFKLKASAIEVKGVTVLGERKVIERGVTSSIRNISTDDIKNMPVKEISEILATQVGFVTKGDQLHIRGGRAGEALYIVDGVETRDLLGGLGKVTGGMNVSSSNIEEISIQKDGFDPEYGNVQSAVISLVTKEGSSKITSGYFEFMTDDFGTSQLNRYSRNSDRVEFSLNGPDPFLTTKFLPAIGIKFLGEKLSYYLSGIAYKTDTYYEVNKYATPTTQKKFRVDNFLGFDVPERMSNDYSAIVKLAYKASADKKLVLSHIQNWERYSLFFDPSGGSTSNETRGAVNIWAYRYTPSTIPQIDYHNNSLSLLFTHQVSKSSFYELMLSRYVNSYFQRPGDPNNPGGGLDPGSFTLSNYWERFTPSEDANYNGQWDDAEPYLDVNQNGQYDIGEPFQDTNKGKNGVHDPGESFLDYDRDGVYTKGVDGFDAKTMDLPGEGRWNDAEQFDWDSDDPNDPNDGVDGADGKFNQWKEPQAWGSTGIDFAEAYEDGDVNLGEPYIDLNKNGMYDFGESYSDLNFNGKYDSPNDVWTPGVPFDDRNHNGVFDYPNSTWDPGEYYVDSNQNGKWDGVDGFYDRGNERRCYYQSRNSTNLTLKFDFTSQVTKEHQLRTGIMVERMKLSFADLRYPYYQYDGPPDPGPWPDRGIFRDFYTRRPIRGAYYFRDKIEYGAMVANIGFRYDFFAQSADIRGMKAEDTPTETAPVDTKSKLSPRIGISYPITDKAKVYFNYGHFYQLPELQWMYMQKTQGSGIKQYGNYNLDYMKQIQYSLGVDYALSSNYKLTVSGFYKDIFGQLNTDLLQIGPATFEYWSNIDYGRARGLELQLDKRYGGYISGYVNYQYAFAYGKSSSEASNYYNRAVQGGDIPIQEFPLDWDVRHQITSNLDLRIPEGEHPKMFGFKLPDAWDINVIWQYNSGFAFTPNGKYPGQQLRVGENPQTNSKRMPASSNVDIRFNKDFKIWKLSYSIQAWINNVFDRKDVVTVYGTSGRPDTNQNYFDQAFSENVVYKGQEIEMNPLYYGPGRQVRLSFSVKF